MRGLNPRGLWMVVAFGMAFGVGVPASADPGPTDNCSAPGAQCNVEANRGTWNRSGVSGNFSTVAISLNDDINANLGLFYDANDFAELGWGRSVNDSAINVFGTYVYAGCSPNRFCYNEFPNHPTISGSHTYGFKFVPNNGILNDHFHYGVDGDTLFSYDFFTVPWHAGIPVTNAERDTTTDLFNADVVFSSLKYWSGLNWYSWESWGCFGDNDPLYQNDRLDNSNTTVRVRREAGANC